MYVNTCCGNKKKSVSLAGIIEMECNLTKAINIWHYLRSTKKTSTLAHLIPSMRVS